MALFFNEHISYEHNAEAKTFYALLEQHCGKIPEYIKNIMFLNGFTSPLVVGELNESDMNEMEIFVRNVMPTMCPVTENYFGVFTNNIKGFFFIPGHKKLIKIISQVAKESSKLITHQIIDQVIIKTLDFLHFYQ